MAVDPEDLVETFHLVVANGDEPVSWTIDEPLWRRVVAEASANGYEVDERSMMTLLGLPVEIGTPGHAPILYIVGARGAEAVPIIGPMSEG